MKMTGESNEGLRKVNDASRVTAFVILFINIYYYNYGYFDSYGISHDIRSRHTSAIYPSRSV